MGKVQRMGIRVGLLILGLAVQGWAQSPVTLFVVGDSTASNGPDLGWGSHLGKYFDPSKVTVVNRAMAGRSSRTFKTEGRWDRVVAELKSGDFMLIQFGHNDGSPVDRPPARGSLPGLGEETQEVTAPSGGAETVHTFGWYLRKYIADTRAKGATPIVLSLTVRNLWTDGRVERGSGQFVAWSAEVARSRGVGFVDLTNLIADQYELMGPVRVATFFPRDHTHTSAEAANLNAALVVSGLKGLQDCPLPGMLSPEGQAVTPAGEAVISSSRPRI